MSVAHRSRGRISAAVADKKTLGILKQGVEAWNQWRKERLIKTSLREKPADLREANLRGAKLSSVNLLGADLRGAILNEAVLNDADIRFANLRGANLCK